MLFSDTLMQITRDFARGTVSTEDLHDWIRGRVVIENEALEADLWGWIWEIEDGVSTEEQAREHFRSWLSEHRVPAEV